MLMPGKEPCGILHFQLTSSSNEAHLPVVAAFVAVGNCYRVVVADNYLMGQDRTGNAEYLMEIKIRTFHGMERGRRVQLVASFPSLHEADASQAHHHPSSDHLLAFDEDRNLLEEDTRRRVPDHSLWVLLTGTLLQLDAAFDLQENR